MSLDPQITRRIQQYLDTPETDRDPVAGASLMLQLNRNRALYNSILRKPENSATNWNTSSGNISASGSTISPWPKSPRPRNPSCRA